MRITKSQLRRTIRRVIKESIPIYAGKDETPPPYEVEKWATGKGFECYDYRGYPYPKICKKTHDENPDLFFVIEAHRNMSLGRCFIKVSVYEYTEENPRGNPPVYHIKEANVHNFDELADLYMDFLER